MFKKISKELEVLTVKKAEAFLECNTFQDQRKVRPKWVAELSSIIKNGEFLTGEIAIARLNYNGCCHVLVNGQHQSLAVLQCGIPVDIVLEKYSCDDPEDLALLYRQFDNHARRSLANVSKPEASAIGLKWPPRIVSLIITAASILENKTTVSKNEKVKLLYEYKDSGGFVAGIIAPDNSVMDEAKHLIRGAVAAAMIQTWRKNHSDAETFWTQVRDGEELKRSMPSYKLRNYLLGIVMTCSTRTSAHLNGSITIHEVMSKSITAWNAFRKSITTDLKYYIDKPTPKVM